MSFLLLIVNLKHLCGHDVNMEERTEVWSSGSGVRAKDRDDLKEGAVIKSLGRDGGEEAGKSHLEAKRWRVSNCVKKKRQVQNGAAYVKPHQDLIVNLIAVSTCPQSRILNHSVWHFLISTSEVISIICMRRPPSPPPKGRWPYLKQLLVITSLSRHHSVPAHFCLEKLPIWHNSWELPSICLKKVN